MSEQKTVQVFMCGPQSPKCQCRCGPNGKDCEHDFSVSAESEDGLSGWLECSKCGMANMDHDMWVCP